MQNVASTLLFLEISNNNIIINQWQVTEQVVPFSSLTLACMRAVAEINVLILIIQESIYYTYFCKRKINVMTIVDHYGDIARQLSLKISQNNHSQCKLLEIINSDSYSHFNIAFLLYNYCIIKVYLFEFNKLIQQFWICSNSYKFLN